MATYHRLENVAVENVAVENVAVENVVAERLDTNPTSLALQNGKEYHVIFCFENTDRDWVTKYLEKLEGDPYQFHCCYDDRDFMASKDIIDNIGDLMQKSMTAIFVISPEHTTSNYCRIETCLALEQKGEKKLQVIPVLRRGDQTTVPIAFRPIHYIDARDGVSEEKVLRKIVRAINHGPDRVQLTLSEDPAPIPPDLNGSAVVIKSQDGRKNDVVQKWSKVFEDVNEDHVRDCETMGSKIPRQVLEDIRNLMSDSPLLRAHRLIISGCQVTFLLWVMVTFAIGGIPWIVASLTFVLLGMDEMEFPVIINGLVLMLVIPVVAGILVWRVKKTRNRFLVDSMRRAGEISQHLFQTYHILVAFHNYQPAPYLQIFKYDVEDCQDSVANLLRNGIGCDVTPEYIEQISKRMVHEAIPRYLSVLTTGRLKAVITRHRVRNDVICLCQFFEIYYLHPFLAAHFKRVNAQTLTLEQDDTTILIQGGDTDIEQTTDA